MSFNFRKTLKQEFALTKLTQLVDSSKTGLSDLLRVFVCFCFVVVVLNKIFIERISFLQCCVKQTFVCLTDF